jgi:hypothetical protein
MKHFNANRYRITALIAFFLMTVCFAWTYSASPFSEPVNSIILNGGTTISAMIAAIIFTLIPFYYQPDEQPRMIWIAFAAYAWLWTIAEAIWGYIYIRDGEVPGFTLADVFWLLGYIALTISLGRQFRLISFSRSRTVAWAALGVWLGVWAVVAVILIAIRSETPIVDFFVYFYLLADGVIGLLALYLVYAFGGRVLAIPWLAISSFVISDFIYIRLTESGAYDYVMSGVSIALLADTLYVVAYLLIAWGGLEQYLLLRSSAEPSRHNS